MNNGINSTDALNGSTIKTLNLERLWKLFMEHCQRDSFGGELRIMQRVCYTTERLKELFDDAAKEWHQE